MGSVNDRHKMDASGLHEFKTPLRLALQNLWFLFVQARHAAKISLRWWLLMMENTKRGGYILVLYIWLCPWCRPWIYKRSFSLSSPFMPRFTVVLSRIYIKVYTDIEPTNPFSCVVWLFYDVPVSRWYTRLEGHGKRCPNTAYRGIQRACYTMQNK